MTSSRSELFKIPSESGMLFAEETWKCKIIPDH